MIDPVLALLAASGVGVVVVTIFWPRLGLWPRWKRMTAATDRIRMEDALKHFFHFERARLLPTAESLAGILSVSRDDASRLIARLEQRGLIATTVGTVELSDEGRRYALRIVRMHRLWERHLADETGMSTAEWHAQAEEMEHLLTAEQADALEDKMGRPRYDPHGDPIPTADGDMPGERGVPMSTLEAGAVAEVVHVEDEPRHLFSLLADRGIEPGVRVRVSGTTGDQFHFVADGNPLVLPRVAAASCTVRRLPDNTPMEGPFASLADLLPGQQVRVIGIGRTLRGSQRRRLMDLGLVPGTVVEVELESAGGDPTAYIIRGASIALRRQQARSIRVEPLKN